MAFFLLSLLLAAFITAQDACSPEERNYQVDRPEQVDAISSNCTTFFGSITIRSNYTGPFVLNNVTNITGGLDMRVPVVENLSSIQLPDLVSVGGSLNLNGIVPDHNLTFPRLESVNETLELSYFKDGHAHFPSLTRVGRIEILGNVSR